MSSPSLVFFTLVIASGLSGLLADKPLYRQRHHRTPAESFFYAWAEKDGLERSQVFITPVATNSASKLRAESSSTPGWVYSGVFTDSKCDGDALNYEYAYATNQCFLTETYQGTKYSVMTTCSGGIFLISAISLSLC